MNKILYRPNLSLPKRYDTDGLVEPYREPLSSTQSSKPSKEEELEQIADDILSLQHTLEQLPSDIKPIVDTMFNTLQFMFVQIDKDYLPEKNNGGSSNNSGLGSGSGTGTGSDENTNYTDSEDDADIVITTPEVDEDAENEMNNSLLFSDVVPTVQIKTMPKDKIKLINRKYCVTLLEITKDYINELKKVTTQYFMDVGMLMLEHDKKTIDFLEKRYSYKTTDLKNKDLHHVSDFLIKSQIVRNQKQRMMEKLINEEESLNKIKACEVARELNIRYSKEEYRNNTVYHDLFSNMSLKESRLSYEQKMDNNLYELYKYMNSSVILLDECLRLYMREAQAKSILIKEEGIKL